MTDNDNQPLRFVALDSLPLFATDKEIAVAIVGRTGAAHWLRSVLPTLEHRGFPAVDPLHLGRAVPLVRKFYQDYFGITAGFVMEKPGGEKKAWEPKRKRAERPSAEVRQLRS